MKCRTVSFTLHHGVALIHKNNLTFIKIVSFKMPCPLRWNALEFSLEQVAISNGQVICLILTGSHWFVMQGL